MNTFFIIITIAVGIVLEWTMGRIVPTYVYIPFFAIGIFFWFWRLRLLVRLSMAFVIGFFADSIFFLPPGTYIVVFVLLAFFTEFLRLFFSNTFSRVTYVLGIIILTAIFLVLTPSISNMLGYLYAIY